MTSQDMEVIALATAKLVKAAVAEAVTPLRDKILALEARAPIEGPAGPPGPQGERGIDGADGRNGVDGINGKDGAPGERGLDGLNGKDGADGVSGKDGRDGINGKDGPVGRDGRDGVKGEPGLDGKDGLDGFGLEDFALEYDGERSLTFVFERGNLRRTKTIELSHVLYRDVYADGHLYARGDAVTWGGSVWVANEATTDKPGTSKAWKLAVKRGRDGRDGKAGPKGDRA